MASGSVPPDPARDNPVSSENVHVKVLTYSSSIARIPRSSGSPCKLVWSYLSQTEARGHHSACISTSHTHRTVDPSPRVFCSQCHSFRSIQSISNSLSVPNVIVTPSCSLKLFIRRAGRFGRREGNRGAFFLESRTVHIKPHISCKNLQHNHGRSQPRSWCCFSREFGYGGTLRQDINSGRSGGPLL